MGELKIERRDHKFRANKRAPGWKMDHQFPPEAEQLMSVLSGGGANRRDFVSWVSFSFNSKLKSLPRGRNILR